MGKCCGAATIRASARWNPSKQGAHHAQTRTDDRETRALSAALVDAASIDEAHSVQPSRARHHLTELTGFGSNPGALRMFTHAPKNLAPSPALVVVLHGCTQSAASYDLGAGWSTLADRYGFVLLLPGTDAREQSEDLLQLVPARRHRARPGEALSIRQMIEKTIGAHGIDRGRVFITGLSAGGAMAAAMLATYPEVFAARRDHCGPAIWRGQQRAAGLREHVPGPAPPAREWGDLVRALRRIADRWPRVSVWHGDADATVMPLERRRPRSSNGPTCTASTRRRSTRQVDGYPRKIWRRDGNRPGRVLHHHRHGAWHAARDRVRTKVAAAPGPFLLEAGISSSYHIAKFFGLTGACARTRTAAAAREQSCGARCADDVEIIPDDRVEILDGITEGRYSGPLQMAGSTSWR